MRENEEQSYEVVVVGGGAAGLSAALTLARSRRRVLVVDAGAPRNGPADHVHNYLGREGTPPADLLASGRDEVRGYGGEIVEGTATSARRLDPTQDGREDGGGFRLVLADGRSVRARRLLVATGLVDELPDVPGVAERFGRDVVHCPYCHGWEVRDRAIGVLATSPMAVHQALLFRQWSTDVTLLVHSAPDPTPEQRERLAARGIAVVEGAVAALDVSGDQLTGVRLRSGDVVPCRALAVLPRLRARADWLAPLGLEPGDADVDGHVVGTVVPAGATGATSVPGVWVAGNVTDMFATVVGAAAAGVNAAAAVNADLVAEDVDEAVGARRRAVDAMRDGDNGDDVSGRVAVAAQAGRP